MAHCQQRGIRGNPTPEKPTAIENPMLRMSAHIATNRVLPSPISIRVCPSPLYLQIQMQRQRKLTRDVIAIAAAPRISRCSIYQSYRTYLRLISPIPAATFKPVLPWTLSGCSAMDLSNPPTSAFAPTPTPTVALAVAPT